VLFFKTVSILSIAFSKKAIFQFCCDKNRFFNSLHSLENIEIQNPEDINILITHGALDGGTEEFREYNPLRETRLKKIGFDYIALGHIHKPYYKEEKDQRIVYPGSPISLGFD